MPPCLLAIRSLLPSRSRYLKATISSRFLRQWPSLHRQPHRRGYGVVAGKADEPDEANRAKTPITSLQPIKDGHIADNFYSPWRTRYKVLHSLKYAYRQDEDGSIPEEELLSFGQSTVHLANEVRQQMQQKGGNLLLTAMVSTSAQWAAEKHIMPESGAEEGDDLTQQAEDDKHAKDQGSERGDDVEVLTSTLLDNLRADSYQYWHEVLLYFLAYDPDSALRFLCATSRSPYPPMRSVEDSLLHLARMYSVYQNSLQKLGLVCSAVVILAERSTEETLSLRHGTIAYALRGCSQAQMLQLWELVRSHRIQIHWQTILHFATRLAHADYFDLAVDALFEAHKKAVDLDHNLDHDALRMSCNTVLRSAMRQPSGLRASLRIIDKLVEMGATLNLILCNVLILNAAEAQDFKTAWSIYHSLDRYDLKPDEDTFGALLKGCRLNLGDVDMLNETIQNAIAQMDVKKNAKLSANILYTLALHHTEHHPEKAFETVLEAYSQLFDTRPLYQLRMVREGPSTTETEKKMPPNQSAIGIMLSIYLHKLFLETQSHEAALTLYIQFRYLVKRGLEPFVSMLRTDYAHNAFLSAMTKTREGLPAAAAVLKHMQEFARTGQGCEPSVQSWTVLMLAYQKHGNMKYAEKVLETMRKKGLEPDRFMLNGLVEGYAGLQDVEGVESALKRLDESGLGWDAFTKWNVAKLKNGRQGMSREE